MPRQVSLVLAGGVALGAYQAGAYAELDQHQEYFPRHLAGASIGAVNAALIAGNPRELRVERLRLFWEAVSVEPVPVWMSWSGSLWRDAYRGLSMLQTRMFGSPGLFQPRVPELLLKPVTGIYDLSPLRAKLENLVDFDRLNGGEIRVSVVATDLETGRAVTFDTHKGDRIGPDHLVASCGLLPDFTPVEIDGRLLGDGGLVANAPVESVLRENGSEDGLCFVLDLFSPEGSRPRNLEEAAARRWDLIFGNQTRHKLESLEREIQLQWELGRAATLGADAQNEPAPTSAQAGQRQSPVTVFHLIYRPPASEAGHEKQFDFSGATLAQRWEAGRTEMGEAVRRAASAERPRAGIAVHRIQR